MSRVLLVVLSLWLAGCRCEGLPGLDGGAAGGGGSGGAGGGDPSGRCELDLSAFTIGTGTAAARQVASAQDLVGGPNAQGKLGDYLMENEKIRVVVQGPGRVVSPNPFGGNIIDADLRRSGPGQDQFGEMGLLYNFGRTYEPTRMEVLADGSDGRSAVLAATGLDARNDWLSIRNKLGESLGAVPLADPYRPMPLLITTYFVLNPQEQRVKVLTAFCNTSSLSPAELAVGDVTDPGYVLEYFNPQSCTNGFGYGGVCFGLDRMPWYGYQGQGVAYGSSAYRPGSPSVPEAQGATLSVAGITGSIIGAPGVSGLLQWLDANRPARDGQLTVPPLGSEVYARDFWVARDLGELSNLIEESRAAGSTLLGVVNGVVRSSGQPLEGARVVFEGDNGRAVFMTDAAGAFVARLPLKTYQASAWAAGRLPTPKTSVQVTSSAPSQVSFDLADPRTLTVTVREANGGPMPAKVTVLCTNGACAVPNTGLALYTDLTKDPTPGFVRSVEYVPASGTLALKLPSGQYNVLVSRGPEYSIFPNDYPAVPGVAVDLRTSDQTLDAVLARVLDTHGWMSADFHVHAVNSPDSIVDNATRALTFAADGLDVLVSSDHDVVTDFGPIIAATGLTPFLATVVGEEVSPMEFGHYNLFPLVPDATDLVSFGAVDWPGANRETLTVAEIFAAGRVRGARTVHFNHPRGYLGGFTYLKVDTDSLATHADPVSLGMSPQPTATSSDTALLSSDFNALEVLNPGEDLLDGAGSAARGRFNDWFTLLSRGLLVTATGVSDTHTRAIGTGWRTWVQVGVDAPQALVPSVLSDAVNARRAVASNGPFVTMQAYRVDAAGAQVTTPVGIGGTVPPDSRRLGVNVEVQVPEYLDITRVELYMHQPQDDLACPLDVTAPRISTTRVACGGTLNTNWPASGITASQVVVLTAGDLQAVAADGALTFKRYRKTVSFTLPAPTTDNWLVAMVYGSKTLAPLNYPPPSGSGSVTATAPFALTNPILIDADGNGYDKPPFSPPTPKRKAPEPMPPRQPLPRDEASVLRRYGEIFSAQ